MFRPDSVSDYSVGAFGLLIDDLTGGGDDLRGITLIEQTTVVGGTTLQAGDFLYSRSGGADDHDIWIYETGTTGVGATPDARVVLLAGDDAQVGIQEKIYGLDLLEEAATIGGQTYAAGTVFVNVNSNEAVGANGLTVGEFDVFALDITQARSRAASGSRMRRYCSTARRSALVVLTAISTPLCSGRRVGLWATSILSLTPPAGAPHTIAEGAALNVDGSNSSDPDGTITNYEWDIGNNGSFEKTGVTTSFTWGELVAAGVVDDGNYNVALRVTDDLGAQDTEVFTLTVNNVAPTLTAFGAAADMTDEDIEVEITFAELAAQGDENDIVDAVDAFIVKSLTSGTLNIGATSDRDGLCAGHQ